MADRIALPGTRNDVPDLLSAADLFVLSSEREGLPVSLLEAMAAGTAIVTTDVGGVGEVVMGGESALLVMHGDASALASAMERVLTDAVLRQKLINNASRAVKERFSMNNAAAELGDLYELLVAKKENG
jgi:glycosyltransferase involved in cell wall biosynthesis